jgi:hypothetical protein
MASIAQEHSLFQIDAELDGLLDEIEEEIESRGEASATLMDRFQHFCEAHGEKVDRIGRFLRMMEAGAQFCRDEAARFEDRARSTERKIDQTKGMVLYYLKSPRTQEGRGKGIHAPAAEEQSRLGAHCRRVPSPDVVPQDRGASRWRALGGDCWGSPTSNGSGARSLHSGYETEQRGYQGCGWTCAKCTRGRGLSRGPFARRLTVET